MHHEASRITSSPRQIIGILIFLCLVGILFLLALPFSHVLATVLTITQTTVNDFNGGTFYHTGLTQQTAGGGDGDGEVRLLTIGISSATWRSDGNVTNLIGLQGHAAAQKNGRIYVSGGTYSISPLTYTAAVSYTTILTTNHNLANWSGTTSLPDRRQGHAMLAVNSFMYVVGGQDTTFAPTSTVYVASINSNGSLGAWTTTAPLPSTRSDFASTVVSGTIYVIGGQTFIGGFIVTATNTIFYAKPDPSTGAITNWLTATAQLPVLADRQTAANYNGTIYEMGGTDFVSNYYPNVFFATPDSSGDISSWTSTVNLPTNLIFATSVAFAGQLYVVGGAYNNGTTLTNTIASNLVNPDKTLVSGGWTNSNVLSAGRQRSAAVLSDDGWIYVIEGNPGNAQQPLHTIDYGPTTGSGALQYIPLGDFVSSVMDLGQTSQLQSFAWNATVTDTNKVTLTLEYRAGNTPNLGNLAWTTLGNSAQGTSITNTTTITSVARYIQYHAILASSQTNVTPVLNRVQITYIFGLPDLVITNISYPIHIQAGQTYTTSVYLTNQGISPACPLGFIPQANSRDPNSNRARQTPTSCFFRVELYIDRAPPSGFTDLGNCTLNAQPSWGTFNQGSFDPGAVFILPIPCTFSTSNPHTFYAMVDSCDNPVNGCSASYGWIFESDETNNVFGPAQSGAKPQFLPSVLQP